MTELKITLLYVRYKEIRSENLRTFYTKATGKRTNENVNLLLPQKSNLCGVQSKEVKNMKMQKKMDGTAVLWGASFVPRKCGEGNGRKLTGHRQERSFGTGESRFGCEGEHKGNPETAGRENQRKI